MLRESGDIISKSNTCLKILLPVINKNRLIQLGLILGENASTHTPVWDILNGREEEDDDFTTGSKKVKCLQTGTVNQMGLALNLTLLSHGNVTMGKGSYF